MSVLGSCRTARRWIPALVAVVALAAAGRAGAIASSSPPNTAIGGGFATISVGAVTVKGKHARLPLHCSGTHHSTCFVLVTMRAIEKHHRREAHRGDEQVQADRRGDHHLPQVGGARA
jgi:hypothetical protein